MLIPFSYDEENREALLGLLASRTGAPTPGL
jgi:hypothetical protein